MLYSLQLEVIMSPAVKIKLPSEAIDIALSICPSSAKITGVSEESTDFHSFYKLF